MANESRLCGYCRDRPPDGEALSLRLTHAASGKTKTYAMARCGACQGRHGRAMRVMLGIFFVGAFVPFGAVFWKWFVALDGSPRGFQGMILISAFLASLPGIGLAFLVGRFILRSGGGRGPLDVRDHPDIAPWVAEGWRVSR
ncbi:MAG: hypothetical protein AAGH15_03235 [Myxococcota bacterium]